MAVVNVEQREIVEIPFTMPDGTILPHPALVISRNELGHRDRYVDSSNIQASLWRRGI